MTPPPAVQLWGPAARQTMAGFFLSGMLMAFVGAVLPAWGYHLESDYAVIGGYFLSLNAGILLSVPLAQGLQRKCSLKLMLTLGAAIAAVAFFSLALLGPPIHFSYRMGGIFLTGAGAGILNLALFRSISPVYRRDPAAAVNLSGMMFGLGSLTVALLVSGTFYVYTTGAILFFIGVIPSFLAFHFYRTDWTREPPMPQAPLRQAVDDFKSPAAILFAMLLFFQFGNEWAISGWLPLFLAQRLGVSPSNSLLLLALYWLSLVVGRIAIQAVLPRVRHTRLLMGSVIAAMFGCIMLSLTNNLFGATVAILLVGSGFAATYPLVVEKIGTRFPYFHPGVFNGLFSLAVTGGLLAAASLGMWAQYMGIGVVMGLPLVGSIAVFILLLLIWLEAKLTAALG